MISFVGDPPGILRPFGMSSAPAKTEASWIASKYQMREKTLGPLRSAANSRNIFAFFPKFSGGGEN